MGKFLKSGGAIVSILLLLILFYPDIFFQDTTFISSGVIYTDLYLFNYPLKDLLHKSILRGDGIPLWTDLIGNGYPIFAEGQMGALYPLHLLFFSLPFATVKLFHANLMLHFFAAGLFTYLYLRQALQLQRFASVFGAMLYMFCGYMLTHLHQVNIVLIISYLPLNFLLIEKILKLEKPTFKNLFIFITILTINFFFQLNAGHIEMFYYNSLFTAFYILIRLIMQSSIRQFLIPKLAILIISSVLTIILSLPQLLATYELVTQSQRSEGLTIEHSTGALWPLETLILFINPKAYDVYRVEPGYSPNSPYTINIGAIYAYYGIIPLILTFAALALLFTKKDETKTHKPWIITFTIILILTYIYAIGRSTQLFSVVWEIVPGLKFFRFPIKSIYVIQFAMAVLAAITFNYIHQFLTQRQKNQATLSIMTLILAISFIDIRIFNRPIQPTVNATDWLKEPDFATFIKSQNNNHNFQNWRTYTHGSNNIDYSRIFDYPLQKDIQNILHTNFNMTHDIHTNKEWAVLFLARQQALNRFNTGIDMQKGELIITPQLKKSLDLQSTRYLIANLPLIHPDIKLVKEHLLYSPVKHVVNFAGSTEVQHVMSDRILLYENTTYTKRINIIPKSNALYMQPDTNNAQNILNILLDEKFDPSRSVVIEGDNQPSSTAPITNFKYTWKVNSYQPHEMKISVDTERDSYFVLTDTWYPGWKATVNGEETQILRANYNFRAIEIPKGKSEIHLYYKPKYKFF